MMRERVSSDDDARWRLGLLGVEARALSVVASAAVEWGERTERRPVTVQFRERHTKHQAHSADKLRDKSL